MEERRGRRSMMWSRNRDSNSSTEPSTPSAIPSPKEMDTTQSSGGNRSPSASDEESSPSNETSSRRSRPSLVMRAEEIVHRVMATPPRSIPPARLSPPRYDQPTTANASATTPAPGQVSSLVAPRNGSENKSKLKKGRSYEIPILLVFFCITAIVCTAIVLVNRLTYRHRLGILPDRFPELRPFLLYPLPPYRIRLHYQSPCRSRSTPQ